MKCIQPSVRCSPLPLGHSLVRLEEMSSEILDIRVLRLVDNDIIVYPRELMQFQANTFKQWHENLQIRPQIEIFRY